MPSRYLSEGGLNSQARATARSRPSTTPSPLPPRELASTLREQERNARRRYQAAIAAALETLRYAEQHFAEVSSTIDAHIQRRLAAAADRTIRSPIQANGTGPAEELAAASATPPIRSHAGRSTLSPVPSGSAP